MFKQILSDLHGYVKNIKEDTSDNYLKEIQTAILLTGINLPDHEVLFSKLTDKFSSITNHIALVQSRDSTSMKSLVEETIYQLLNSPTDNCETEFKKNQCNFRVLEAWYKEYCEENTPLVIIIPDFESFNSSVLRDFILILRYINNLKKLL